MQILAFFSHMITPVFHFLSRRYSGSVVTTRSSVTSSKRFPCPYYRPPLPYIRRSLLPPPYALLANKKEAARFKEALGNGENMAPLYRCIFCDYLTPVLAYRCLVKENQREAPSFLYESVEQGSQKINVVDG